MNGTQLRFRRLFSTSTLIALAGTVAAACGDSSSGDDRDCIDVGARVAALGESAAVVRVIADDLRAKVVGACANIAGVPVPAIPTDQDTQTLCDAAISEMQASLNGQVRIIVVPPVCTIDAQAQFDCEAECQATAQLSCDPPLLDLRCEPGQLSVECAGTCNVEATCEGSLDVAVNCEGTCSGVCNGTCSGNCSATNAMGECVGECAGTCTGQCRGSCQITAEDGIECGADARCRGGCTGEFRAPRCEGELTPPVCQGNAEVDCSADCQGTATLDAECEPAEIVIDGDVDAEVAERLLESLPVLLTVARQGALGLTAAGRLTADTVSVGASVASCVLSGIVAGAGQFAASAAASVQASASVSVSFSVSAEVAGSVSSD